MIARLCPQFLLSLIEKAHLKSAFALAKLSMLSAFGSASRLGMERVVLMPLMAYLAGEESTGRLIIALGWTVILGQTSGRAFGLAAIRLYASASEKGQAQDLLGSSLTIMLAGVLPMMAIGIAIYAMIWPWESVKQYLFLLIPLAIYAAGQGLSYLAYVHWRVNLQYGRVAIMEILTGLLVLASLPLAMVYGITGAAWGMAIGMSATLLLIILTIRKEINLRLGTGSTIYWAKKYMFFIPAFLFQGLLLTLLAKAGILVVGSVVGASEVVTYYAAISILVMFSFPLNPVTNVILSVLSRKQDISQISRRSILQHLVFSFMGVIGFFVFVNMLGPFLIRMLYPNQAKESIALLRIMTWGYSLQVLQIFVRPFVVRFARIRFMLALSIVNAFIVITLLLILTLLHGIIGTAYATSISSAIMSLNWFGVYLTLVKKKNLAQNNDDPRSLP